MRMHPYIYFTPCSLEFQFQSFFSLSRKRIFRPILYSFLLTLLLFPIILQVLFYVDDSMYYYYCNEY
jgi:hypothetical protein